MGTVDLLERIRGKTAEERIEKKKRLVGKQASEEMTKIEEEESEEQVGF